MDSWIKKNPGRLSLTFLEQLDNPFTPTNIKSGFEVSGIWPINRNISEDFEFAPCEITSCTSQKNRELLNEYPLTWEIEITKCGQKMDHHLNYLDNLL